MTAQDAMNEITDVLVNQYGLENEPLTEQELRDICGAINSIAQTFEDRSK
jgi:hypothetical protein